MKGAVRRLVALVAVAVLGAPDATAAAASPIQRRTLVLRVTEPPRFLPATPACPAFRLELRPTSTSDEALGLAQGWVRTTGISLGAAGTVTGGGRVLVDANGINHPDFTFLVTLA